MNNEKRYRDALLSIGSQHPANSSDPKDNILIDLFNRTIAQAWEAVNAEGEDDDAKADWCAAELEAQELTPIAIQNGWDAQSILNVFRYDDEHLSSVGLYKWIGQSTNEPTQRLHQFIRYALIHAERDDREQWVKEVVSKPKPQ
jgi:hypothetical protein